MKRTKLYAWGAGLLASLTVLAVIAAGCSAANAAPPVAAPVFQATSGTPAIAFKPDGPPNNTKWFEFDCNRDMDAGAAGSAKFWTATVVNSTFPTVVTAGDNGYVTLTNTGADNDSMEATEVAENQAITFAANRTYTFAAQVTVSDATQADYGFGIGNTDTDWLGDAATRNNGIWFRKDDGDTQWDVATTSGGSATNFTNFATCDTSQHWFVWQLQTDKDAVTYGELRVWYDGSLKLRKRITTPTGNMGLTFGVQNGEAAAKTMKVYAIGYNCDRA